MTTWENIDNVDMENVTVTSDEAFERVTNDEGFVDESKEWYLKQNTAWLVQEIPNVSFLDISDTMLESKKTLFDKKNWNIVVWTEGKSIEAIPQDSINTRLWWNQTITAFPSTVKFDTWDVTDNSQVVEFDENNWRIKILQDWYYNISYWWTINVGSATQLLVNIMQNSDDIMWDDYVGLTWGRMSWGRSMSVPLSKWDYVRMKVDANDDITVLEKYTYLELRYIGKSI